MLVRDEEKKDLEAVYTVNVSAFESPAEASLVDTLRKQASPVISLVAVKHKKVVGHIMFSPVSLSGHSDLNIMGLAPMAVAPAFQKKGIGSALVRAGLARCKVLGFGAVVVLGHPGYYPRFGFAPAARSGIRCEFEAPEDAFMLLELQPGYLHGQAGIINFHDAFKSV